MTAIHTEASRPGWHTGSFISRHDVHDALERVGIDGDEVEIRPSYSGRGMYGDTCWGIVASRKVHARFLVALVGHFTEMLDQDGGQPGDGEELVSRLAEAAEFDTMGTSSIMYFPGWRLA